MHHSKFGVSTKAAPFDSITLKKFMKIGVRLSEVHLTRPRSTFTSWIMPELSSCCVCFSRENVTIMVTVYVFCFQTLSHTVGHKTETSSWRISNHKTLPLSVFYTWMIQNFILNSTRNVWKSRILLKNSAYIWLSCCQISVVSPQQPREGKKCFTLQPVYSRLQDGLE